MWVLQLLVIINEFESMALDLIVFIFSMDRTGQPMTNNAFNAANMVQRGLVNAPNIKRWPDGVVPFKIDNTISKIL